MLRLCQLLILSSTVALTLPPQTPQSPQKPPTDRHDTGQGVKGNQADSKEVKEADSYLATWLVVGNNNEVALAQLAQQRATDPEVKQFAQMLIEDHGRFLQQLQPFAAGTGVTTGSIDGYDPSQDPSGRAQNEGRPQNESRPQNASFSHESGFDHIGLLQDLGKQCLQSSRAELEKKQGPEFDRCFMGMQVGAHMQANDMLTVFQPRASGSLKSVLSEGQRAVAEHLQRAKDITKRLEDRPMTGSSDTGRKPL